MRGQHAPSGLVVLTEGLDVFIPRTADFSGKEAPFSNESKLKLGKFTTKTYCKYLFTVVGRDGSVGVATRYGMDGPGIESWLWARFSATVQNGPGAHSAPIQWVPGLSWGVKRPGRGVEDPPPSRDEVKKRIELYLYSPSGPTWPVLG